MEQFDIIEYLSGLTGFIFDKSVLKRIALDRGVENVTSYSQLEQRQKDLLLADELKVIYLSPNSSASLKSSHGDFSKSVGSQTINDKKGVYNTMIGLYKKWGEECSGVGEMTWME